MFSVVTCVYYLNLLDTATSLYTRTQKSKATETGGSSENEDQIDNNKGNACQREKQNPCVTRVTESI